MSKGDRLDVYLFRWSNEIISGPFDAQCEILSTELTPGWGERVEIALGSGSGPSLSLGLEVEPIPMEPLVVSATCTPRPGTSSTLLRDRVSVRSSRRPAATSWSSRSPCSESDRRRRDRCSWRLHR